MNIIGHGIDITEFATIDRLLNEPHGDFIAGWFRPAEVALAPAEPGAKPAYFAGRVAAKEAVAKALKTGLIGEMAWTEIEILREATGAPTVTLYGETERIAKSQEITQWLISISYSENYAIASVIAVGPEYS